MKKEMKKAVLVISFGTSYLDTCRRTIEAIEEDMAKAFPGYTIRRAFTSQFIIDKLKNRDNIQVDTVSQALERLLLEGYHTVVCQPTHVMNGHEYDKLAAAIRPFQRKFENIVTGRPLLSQTDDYQLLTQALLQSLPPLESDEAIVFMGHGSSHFADAAYSALAHRFVLEGHPNLLIGTVEGFPLFDHIQYQLKRLHPKKVYVAPLMVVAGDHALNDMAGSDRESWVNQIAAMGYPVTPILKGMGEYPAIRQIYIDHAKDALKI